MLDPCGWLFVTLPFLPTQATNDERPYMLVWLKNARLGGYHRNDDGIPNPPMQLRKCGVLVGRGFTGFNVRCQLNLQDHVSLVGCKTEQGQGARLVCAGDMCAVAVWAGANDYPQVCI